MCIRSTPQDTCQQLRGYAKFDSTVVKKLMKATLQMSGAPLSANVLQTLHRKNQGCSLSFSRFVFIRFIEMCYIIKWRRDDSSRGKQHVPPFEFDCDGVAPNPIHANLWRQRREWSDGCAYLCLCYDWDIYWSESGEPPILRDNFLLSSSKPRKVSIDSVHQEDTYSLLLSVSIDMVLLKCRLPILCTTVR